MHKSNWAELRILLPQNGATFLCTSAGTVSAAPKLEIRSSDILRQAQRRRGTTVDTDYGKDRFKQMEDLTSQKGGGCSQVQQETRIIYICICIQLLDNYIYITYVTKRMWILE